MSCFLILAPSVSIFFVEKSMIMAHVFFKKKSRQNIPLRPLKLSKAHAADDSNRTVFWELLLIGQEYTVLEAIFELEIDSKALSFWKIKKN